MKTTRIDGTLYVLTPLTPLDGGEWWARVDDYRPGHPGNFQGHPDTWTPYEPAVMEWTLVDQDGAEVVPPALTAWQEYQIEAAIEEAMQCGE